MDVSKESLWMMPFFRQDNEAIDNFLPKLQSLLSSEKYAAIQQFFDEFYEFYGEENDFKANPMFFEGMWKIKSIRKKRQKYILLHWFLYQALKITQKISQYEGTVAQIQQMIEKKEGCLKIMDFIVKKNQLDADQKAEFQSNIKDSQIYNQCVKFVALSNDLSAEKIEEKHQQLIYIILKMGGCGESIQYQLQKHILVSFQKAYQKTSNQGVNLKDKLMQINSLFDLMRKCNRLNDRIKEKIQDFKLASNQKSKFNILEGIKSELAVLDVFLLEYLIFLARKNRQLKGQQQPKNIVLLVGPSGSGKTTIILRLLGYKLVQTEIQQLPTLQPQNLRPQHSALRTSPESASVTRYMFSTKIPKTSFKMGLDEDLQICDTPGFEDSAGCEVDISNSISIQTFLKNCASVKLAIVISQRKLGDRMDGIRQIAKIVSSFVVKYSEIEEDVSIILNKFDSQAEYERIKPGVESVLQNLSAAEKSNTEYVAFLSSLAKRFKNKKNVDLIRFDPQKTEIEEVIQQMKQGRIFKPRDVFKYSLSTKSSQSILNRRTTLSRFVREYTGKDNSIALYYLNQLILLNKCLNQNDIQEEINALKGFIRKQVNEKFRTFQRIIDDQILLNGANRNTFKDLNQIKEQVKTFEIFTKFVDKLTTVQKFQSKLTEVKTKMLDDINALSFQEEKMQETKYKAINTIKFFSKFQPQLQKSVLDKLFEAFSLKKNDLQYILANKSFQKIKIRTNQLKNIYEVIQKCIQSMNNDDNNPQRVIISIEKKQLVTIRQLITKKFQQIVKQSTSFIQSYRENSSIFKIKKENIDEISQNITIFEKLEDEGPILNQILAKNYKNKIIQAVCAFGKQLIEQCNKILDPNTNKAIESAKIEYVRHNKTNTLRLKQIKGVYGLIGEQIDRLWANFQRFISIQKQRLNSFLNQLKSQKMVNKNTLKNFKSRIDRIIKFSEGDDNLVESISQLKIEIKKSLVEHIKNLKNKIDKVKINLQLKKTLELEDLLKAFQRFKEIQAFYKIKSFNRQNYLKVSSQTASKLKKSGQKQQKVNQNNDNDNNEDDDQDDEDDDDEEEDVNVSILIKSMYTQTISKILNPFNQITVQSLKIRNGGIKKLNLSYLQALNLFIRYKSYLQENEITLNKDIGAFINQLSKSQQSYLQNIRQMLTDIKDKVNTWYRNSIENKSAQHIYKFTIQEIKQFKRLSNIILNFKKYSYLQELFLYQNFIHNQYIEKIIEMLRKSEEQINIQLSNRNKSNLDSLSSLLFLQNQMEQMKSFDDIDFKDDKINQTKFGQIYKKISQQILTIQGRQSNAITNLFIDETIILSDVKNMYQHLSKDQLKNQENLVLLSNNLKMHGDKLKKSLLAAKELYKNQNSMLLDSQNANNYINKLEKTFKFYEELKIFAKSTLLQGFSIDETYFALQIEDLSIEERLKSTYEMAKGKILSFEYKKKPKQFQNIIIPIMKKAEDIVEQVTKDKLYSQLYSQVEHQENNQINQVVKFSKFSDRLKYFMNKSMNQIKDIFTNENNLSKQQFLNLPYLTIMYNNSTESEKLMIDTKIQAIMHEKLQKLDQAYQKNDEERKIIEQDIRKTLDKLPNSIRKIFKEQFEAIKYKLKERQQAQMNHLKYQLNLKQSADTVFLLFTQFQKCKNSNVQKGYKQTIEKHLNALINDTHVEKNNNNMVQSFKKYLKYFGSQNALIIQRIKKNQKINDIFLKEQRNFLTGLISVERQMIQEIESQFIRCCFEGIQEFNKKCRQMNQLYVLALQDEYNGMCIIERNQLISFWEQCIKKMDQKIQKMMARPQINIINTAPVKVERLIVEIKLVKNFINIFIEQSEKLVKDKTTSFMKLAHEKFTQYNFENIIINLAMQVNQVIKQIRQINFYDDQIKILNFVSLEVQFQKRLIKHLKITKEYQQIYDKYLCQREQDKYETKALIEMTQTKWQQILQATFKEFQSAIIQPEEEISQRISILHNLAQIIKNRRWEVIDKSLLSRQILQKFLDTTFNKITGEFKNDLVHIQEIIYQRDHIEEKYTNIKIQAQKQISQIQQNAKDLMQFHTKKIAQTNDLEAKEKLTVQFQNIESLSRQKIGDINSNNYNNHLKEKQKNQDRLKAYIKNFVIKHLIIMKKITHSVNWKSKENKNILAQFLENVNKKAKSINQIIFKQLNFTNNNYALIIAAESDIFKSQAALDFKNKTSKQGIQYIVENCLQIKNNAPICNELLTFYKMYQTEYNNIIEMFKANPDKQQIMIVAKQLKDQKDKNQSKTRKDGIHPAKTIARIFATWSMTKADLTDKQNISIDFQPHPAQIVAIYLLTGVDEKIGNSLVQVLTGEGKSIVLAGLCIYLALKGFHPYCACYSEYLSTRDQQEFKELFSLLQVSSVIKYGTFGQHCEEIINQSSANQINKAQKIKLFRDQMKLVIMNKANNNTLDYFKRIFDQDLHKNSRKILIIDQADVFFNQNFFGQLYCPSLSLDDQQIKILIAYIWSRTKQSRQNDKIDKITKEQIYGSNEFKNAAQKYPTLKELIQNQVIGMLQAAYNFAHGYIVHQQAIKYRDNDAITDKISYGYKTVFANCYEYDKKAIGQISYNSALKITLNIAPFSYCELPKFFQAILGVSGTVSSMSDDKKNMLRQRYGIEEAYEIPSIYGLTQRTNDNFTIVKDEIFYDKIVEHTQNISQTGRPIALFFKTIKDVINFYKSPQFKQFTKNTTILTEQTDHASRQIIIKRVGQRGKITILTESFARGTDFKVFDNSINQIGGLHVIQTFISSDLSEYIQTRGRTARQGSKGSFQVLINETQLQKFEIVCSQNSQFEDKMKDAWRNKDKSQCVELAQRANKAKQKHTATQNLFKKKVTKKQIVEFICSLNKYNQIKKNHVRTLIGIDGTASMGDALTKVVGILEDSFTRTKTILDKKNVLGSFQNQIAIYRNYNCDYEQIFEYSSFQTEGQKLKSFLQKIKINGGWENEAMQILFKHANNINKLDQIIIIADAKSNTLDQTKWKRKKRGQNYWLKNGFEIAHETQQVLKIKQKKIKIHTLYIYLDNAQMKRKNDLRKYCEDISNSTGGTSSQFKIKAKDASQFLTGFLVKNILMLLGGQEKGKQLVESYNKDFSAPLRL